MPFNQPSASLRPSVAFAVLLVAVLIVAVSFSAAADRGAEMIPVRRATPAFAPYDATAATRTPLRRSKRWATASTASADAQRARAVLANYQERYPLLAGTTVRMGDALGYQAVTFYQTGEIVISSAHTAPVDQIVAHEIWHVIDWRDNGRIDWGERVPPKSAQ